MEQVAHPVILVVEDDEVEREALATLLRREGFEVQEAQNGDQALACLRASTPDIILLDMLLPESRIDGWTFLAYVQRNLKGHSIPVIIVTGLGIACLPWSRSLGATDVFQKPIDLDQLLVKIRKLCALV